MRQYTIAKSKIFEVHTKKSWTSNKKSSEQQNWIFNKNVLIFPKLQSKERYKPSFFNNPIIFTISKNALFQTKTDKKLKPIIRKAYVIWKKVAIKKFTHAKISKTFKNFPISLKKKSQFPYFILHNSKKYCKILINNNNSTSSKVLC